MSYEHAVAHMNADHADALVDIVQAYGSVPDATAVRVVSMDDAGMDVEVSVDDGAPRHTRVPFNPPITDGEVREYLVDLAHQARVALGKA